MSIAQMTAGVHPSASMVKPAAQRMQPSVFRRLQLATFAFLAIMVVALVISAALTALEARHLSEAQEQLHRLHEFDSLQLVVSRRLTTLVEGTQSAPHGRPMVSDAIDRMIALSSDREVPGKLRELRARLELPDAGRVELAETLTLITEVGHASSARERALLARLQAQTSTQLRLELAAPLAILAVGLLLFPLARQRIIKPLDAFGRQLGRLASGEFTPTPEDERVDPFLLPLHQQFNVLAHRLQELEAAHRTRTASLEAEVRTSTRQLLEQQRTLARAERLAATGELAASVAHELRNPLAGIQMTLSNLRNELRDPDLVARIDLVVGEVARLSRLLTELLETGRHAPEPPRHLNLAEVVDDILALTRCQLPANVRLVSRVDPALTGRLPADRLRQALLNLILNAAVALGERDGEIIIDAAKVGRHIRITVTDDGPGFPPELLAQGIRPYFSTRERGTGLGLVMVRRFAGDVGGTIELANRAPHGAQVTLVLPADGEHA
jgi:nitrogen fixation/metabolism regulation signal transduction histidine kinase